MEWELVETYIIPGSPFCGTALNMGPMAAAKKHVDMKNLVGGICLIGALGRFNHRTSAHFVMTEPKVIMEFMSGDLIALPSGSVTHSNTPILMHSPYNEWRCSIVQFTAGGLFRWLWQGKQTMPKGSIRKAQKLLNDEEGRARWQECVEMFPTLAGLLIATQTGFMPAQNIRKKISQGKSKLIPRD